MIKERVQNLKVRFIRVPLWHIGLRIQHCHCCGLGPGQRNIQKKQVGPKKKKEEEGER